MTTTPSAELCTTVHSCPSWCVDHQDGVYKDDDGGLDVCNSEKLAWSDDGAVVELTQIEGEPVEVEICGGEADRDEAGGGDVVIDFAVDPARLRRLSAALLTLAGRLEAAR